MKKPTTAGVELGIAAEIGSRFTPLMRKHCPRIEAAIKADERVRRAKAELVAALRDREKATYGAIPSMAVQAAVEAIERIEGQTETAHRILYMDVSPVIADLFGLSRPTGERTPGINLKHLSDEDLQRVIDGTYTPRANRATRKGKRAR